jgi:transcriptional regulator with XRE-family HTH domain
VVGGTVETKYDIAKGRRAFGRMLGDALKGRGMKQEDLARALGTTQSSVSGWINGKYEPAAGTVFAIERSLGMDPGVLSRPLGYLPVEPAARAVSVEAAIAQSTTLDDEAKTAMTAIYRALVKRSGRAVVPARPHRLAGAAGASDRPRKLASGS